MCIITYYPCPKLCQNKIISMFSPPEFEVFRVVFIKGGVVRSKAWQVDGFSHVLEGGVVEEVVIICIHQLSVVHNREFEEV